MSILRRLCCNICISFTPTMRFFIGLVLSIVGSINCYGSPTIFKSGAGLKEIRYLEKRASSEAKKKLNFAGSVYFEISSVLLLISMASTSQRNLERYLVLSDQIRELEEANRELKKLNSVKDTLLSIISHDVRAPLASVKSLLNLLKQQKFTENEYLEVVESLTHQIEQTNRFLENLLQWTKQNFAKIKPSIDKVALRPLVNDIIDLYSFNALRKKVAIASEVSDDAIIYADAEMIKLVLRNLISNAIKFCNPNDHIYIQSITEKEKVRISVKDTGQGISEKNMATLFGLSHFSTKGTKEELGFGLGLALCKDFVEKMGCHISATSKEGKGSCFEFTVPSPNHVKSTHGDLRAEATSRS